MKVVTIFMCIALLVLGVFVRIMFNEFDQMKKTLNEMSVKIEQIEANYAKLETAFVAKTEELQREIDDLERALAAVSVSQPPVEKKNSDQELIASLKPGESVRLDDSRLAYKVKSGDCLSRLTERFTGCGKRPCWEREWQRLKSDNPDFTNPHRIYPGQVFIFGATP